MSSNDVRELELRRLHELELQAARYGPHTDPGIFIEIQELRTKYPYLRNGRSEDYGREEFLLLLNQVAGMLIRVTELEEAVSGSEHSRRTRQLVHDLWMIAITIIVFATLLLVLNLR
jgi:hypothetical protein